MKADINITPLIDVLLVLLIIFMLVTPVTPTALGAAVPETSKRDDPRGPDSLVLEVRAGEYALNGTVLATPDLLAPRLRDALAGRRDRALFVRVTDDVPYERVVAALDLASGCGAERIGLVDPQP